MIQWNAGDVITKHRAWTRVTLTGVTIAKYASVMAVYLESSDEVSSPTNIPTIVATPTSVCIGLIYDDKHV